MNASTMLQKAYRHSSTRFARMAVRQSQPRASQPERLNTPFCNLMLLMWSLICPS
jgi:hypothetical protein